MPGRAPADDGNGKEDEGLTQQDVDSESLRRKLRHVAVGGACASAAYLTAHRVLQGDEAAVEDVVDLAHSAYTSAVAAAGIARLRRHPVFDIALPRRLALAEGPVLRMLCHSLGYFLADALLIFFELSQGRYPKLWAGRLVHHVIQSTTNGLCLFRTGRPTELLATRTGLCQAYFAEFSTIFLRLGGLARRRRVQNLQLIRRLDWLLLISFGFSRLVNFTFLMRCWLKARPVVSPRLFATFLAVQSSAYALNLGWFAKLARSCFKASAVHPSLEC